MEVSAGLAGRCDLKEMYEMPGHGHSARAIAQELGLARNTVLKYLRSPDAIRPSRAGHGDPLPLTEVEADLFPSCFAIAFFPTTLIAG